MLGYLKKMAKMDSCRGQETNEADNRTLAELSMLAPSTSSPYASPIPPKRTNLYPNTIIITNSSSIDDNPEDDKANCKYSKDQFENDDDDSTTKQQQWCHLLPSSFLSQIGSKKVNSASKSQQGQMSLEDSSSAVSNKTSASSSRKTRSKDSSINMREANPGQSDQPEPLPATSPTTFCPTIASALWRPLWPPGEQNMCTL